MMPRYRGRFYFSAQHHSRHGPVVDPEREGDVEEDPALSADVLLVIAGAAGAGSSVSDQLDGMVQSNVGVVAAAIVDAATVSPPARGVDSHGERSDLSQMSHDGVLVVGSQGVVAGQAHHGRHPVVVVLAVPGDAAVAAGVGPVGISHVTEELEVSVAQLGDGAHTASGAATGESVGGAGGHLLAGQGRQVAGVAH